MYEEKFVFDDDGVCVWPNGIKFILVGSDTWRSRASKKEVEEYNRDLAEISKLISEEIDNMILEDLKNRFK